MSILVQPCKSIDDLEDYGSDDNATQWSDGSYSDNNEIPDLVYRY